MNNLVIPNDFDLYDFAKELGEIAEHIAETAEKFNEDLQFNRSKLQELEDKKEAFFKELNDRNEVKRAELNTESQDGAVREMTDAEKRRNELYKRYCIYYERNYKQFWAAIEKCYARIEELQMKERMNGVSVHLEDTAEKICEFIKWTDDVQWGLADEQIG